jgi:hypothetical protein
MTQRRPNSTEKSTVEHACQALQKSLGYSIQVVLLSGLDFNLFGDSKGEHMYIRQVQENNDTQAE